jgi:hypothetical protein
VVQLLRAGLSAAGGIPSGVRPFDAAACRRWFTFSVPDRSARRARERRSSSSPRQAVRPSLVPSPCSRTPRAVPSAPPRALRRCECRSRGSGPRPCRPVTVRSTLIWMSGNAAEIAGTEA